MTWPLGGLQSKYTHLVFFYCTQVAKHTSQTQHIILDTRHIHKCTNNPPHTYTHTHIHTHISTYSTCIHHTCTNVCTHIHPHTPTHTHRYTHVHTHTPAHTHFTYMYSHTHTHAHVHACSLVPRLSTPFTNLIPKLLHLQFLIACSMQKRREKAWGISSRDPWHSRHHKF